MNWTDALRFMCFLTLFGGFDILCLVLFGWGTNAVGDLIMAAMFTIVAAVREQKA